MTTFSQYFYFTQCISDCMATKIGVNPYEDGSIDEKAFSHYLQKISLDDETWRVLLLNALERCYELTSDKVEDLKISFALHPAFDGEKICHPFSGILMSCIEADLLNNCPKKLWQLKGKIEYFNTK